MFLYFAVPLECSHANVLSLMRADHAAETAAAPETPFGPSLLCSGGFSDFYGGFSGCVNEVGG